MRIADRIRCKRVEPVYPPFRRRILRSTGSGALLSVPAPFSLGGSRQCHVMVRSPHPSSAFFSQSLDQCRISQIGRCPTADCIKPLAHPNGEVHGLRTDRPHLSRPLSSFRCSCRNAARLCQRHQAGSCSLSSLDSCGGRGSVRGKHQPQSARLPWRTPSRCRCSSLGFLQMDPTMPASSDAVTRASSRFLIP